MTGEALKIIGTDYRTPDGSGVRDSVHVEDLADAHVSALLHLIKTGESFAVNLGTEKGSSVSDLMGTPGQLGLEVLVTAEDKRHGDPSSLAAYPGITETLSGWEARQPELKMISASAVIARGAALSL